MHLVEFRMQHPNPLRVPRRMILDSLTRILNPRTRRQIRLGPAFEPATDLRGANARVVGVESALKRLDLFARLFRFAFTSAKVASAKAAPVIGDEHVVCAFVEACLPDGGNFLGVMRVEQRLGEVDVADETFQRGWVKEAFILDGVVECGSKVLFDWQLGVDSTAT